VHADTRIETDLRAGKASIEGDASQVHQIVTNLLTNAIHAMTSGGTLRVSSGSHAVDAPRDLTVGALSPGEYIRVEVADSGTGIALLDRIFDPFFTTKPVGTGTGLGLAVVYGLVRSHGGWIGVESEPVRGSTFRVLLPVAPAGPTAQPGDVAEETAGRGELVLVAEDEPAVRRVACAALRKAGYAVLEATDGAEALDLLRERGGDVRLAVLDLSMPRVDGLTALADMRVARPGLRVLLVSGRFPAELTSAPPGVELLAKPFEPQVLAARVRALLDRQ
jgi:CheY-like chemotaxis protein